MTIDPSIVISISALAISIITLYLQWFRVKGAIIELLNNEKDEQHIVRFPKYNRLPEVTRQLYPEFKEKHSGYAQMRIVLANSGDRAGICEILKAEVESPPLWLTVDRIRASFYNYIIVPPYEIQGHIIILRNIPPIDSETTLVIKLKIAWGGANSRTAKYQQKGIIERSIRVLLVPSEICPIDDKTEKTKAG
jgi:hypothetical protein